MAGPLTFVRQIKHAWNTFTAYDKGETEKTFDQSGIGASYSTQPYRSRMRFSNERSIVSSIYTRLSIDVAGVQIRHVKLDDDGQYQSDMDSGLENCLTVEANIDQGARAFRQDMAMTLFDKGVIAV